jgi:hypothetical protein
VRLPCARMAPHDLLLVLRQVNGWMGTTWHASACPALSPYSSVLLAGKPS